ncbi:hypothetical protein ACHAWF_010060 [Thalassiosira exigua]
MVSSTTIISFAISSATSSLIEAFAPPLKRSHTFTTELKYRSLHHGPDIEPLSEEEKLGADYTKMDKDKIRSYGPGDFAQYQDPHSSHYFDGGDSEMGLSGDGNVGLRKFGSDASPHMARTLTAKMDQAAVERSSYADELLQDNQGMDAVRAQQLENWATQREIATANKFMYEQRHQYNQNGYEYGDYEVRTYPLEMYAFLSSTTLTSILASASQVTQSEAQFVHPVELGDEIEGTIALRAFMNGVAVHDIMVSGDA